jgi:hypothetical protein
MNNQSAVAISLSVLMLLGVTVASSGSAYAHTFVGDESASFLAIVEVIKVHLQLAQKDFGTNATMAAEHVHNAREHLTDDTIKEITERNQRLGTDLPGSLEALHESLEMGNATAASVNEQVARINDLLSETVAVRIDRAQLSNSTVQAIMFGDFIDEVLESYSGSFGSGIADDNSTTPTEEDFDTLTTFELMEKYPSLSDDSQGMDNATTVNTIGYESAQALAARAQELFNTKLKAMAEANATLAVTKLDAGLMHLKQAIDAKAPHDDVDTIVHSEIEPNIQQAFNLQIIPEFPIPILAAILGISSIVVYSQIRRIKRLQ